MGISTDRDALGEHCAPSHVGRRVDALRRARIESDLGRRRVQCRRRLGLSGEVAFHDARDGRLVERDLDAAGERRLRLGRPEHLGRSDGHEARCGRFRHRRPGQQVEEEAEVVDVDVAILVEVRAGARVVAEDEVRFELVLVEDVDRAGAVEVAAERRRRDEERALRDTAVVVPDAQRDCTRLDRIGRRERAQQCAALESQALRVTDRSAARFEENRPLETVAEVDRGAEARGIADEVLHRTLHGDEVALEDDAA